MYEKPAAPAGIGGVLDDGLRLWRLSLPFTWGLALLAQAVGSAPSILFPPSPVVTPAGADLTQRLLALMAQSSRHSLLAFVFLMVSYVFVNAVMLRINSVSEDREISFSESVASGFGFLLRTWWFFLLIGIGIFLFVAVILIFGLAIRKASASGAQIAMLSMGLIAGLYIMYAAIKLVVGYPAMIVDDLSAWDALRASWNLTQGYWWRVTMLLTVVGVIGLVLGAVLGIVAGLTLGLFGAGSRVAVLMIQFLTIVAYSFLGSLSPAVILAIYNDLKLRKEGGDLADRVGALASR